MLNHLQDRKADAAIADYFANGSLKTYPKSKIILEIGETPIHGYLVVSGHIKTVTYGPSGEERINLVINTGQVFPLPWLFQGVRPRGEYIAMDEVVVRYLPCQSVEKFLYESREALLSVTHQLLVGYDRLYNLNLEPAKLRIV